MLHRAYYYHLTAAFLYVVGHRWFSASHPLHIFAEQLGGLGYGQSVGLVHKNRSLHQRYFLWRNGLISHIDLSPNSHHYRQTE